MKKLLSTVLQFVMFLLVYAIFSLFHLNAHAPQSVSLTDEVYTALGAANVVKRYQTAGAGGGKPFQDQLAAWKRRVGV